MQKAKAKGILPRAPGISWVVLLLLWCIFAINASCREVINKVMPAIVDEFNMSSSVSGLIGTLGTMGSGILSIPISRWADQRGQGWKRKGTQLIVAVIYCALTIAVGIPAICSSVVMLGIIQCVKFGFCGGGETVEVSNTAEWWPQEERGFVIAAHHTGYPWGTALTSLVIAGVLSATGNWRMAFIIVPLLGVPFWIIYLIYANKKRFAAANARMEQMGLTPSISVEVIEQASRSRQNKEKEKTGEETVQKTPMSKLIRNPNVLGCFLGYMGVIGAYFGLSYWLTPYLSYIAEFDYAQAAAYSIFFTITGGLGQIFWGTFSDRIGCKRTLLICIVWLVIGFALLPTVSRGLGWVIGIQLFVGFCTNACFPVFYSFAGSSVKKTEMATALGICGVSQIFGGLVPYLLGTLIGAGGGWESSTGYTIGLYVMVGMLVVAFLAVLLLTHDTTGSRRGKDWALTSYRSCGIED